MVPLAHTGFPQNHRPVIAQPRHHPGVARRNRAEQRVGSAGGVHLIRSSDAVLEEHGDAVQRRTAAAADPPPLDVGRLRLSGGVGVHLDHGAEHRIQAPDAVQVELDELAGSELPFGEGALYAADGGFFDRETAAAGVPWEEEEEKKEMNHRSKREREMEEQIWLSAIGRL